MVEREFWKQQGCLRAINFKVKQVTTALHSAVFGVVGWPFLATRCLPGCSVAHLLDWTEGENTKETFWVEIRTGRSFSNYCHWQDRLNLRKLICWQFVTESDSEKLEQNLNPLSPTPLFSGSTSLLNLLPSSSFLLSYNSIVILSFFFLIFCLFIS